MTKADNGMWMDFESPECQHNALTAAQWASWLDQQFVMLATQFNAFLAEIARSGRSGPAGPPNPDDAETLRILNGS